MKKYLFSLFVISSLILAGCGTADKKQSSEPKEEHASHSQQGDIQETTKGVDTLPTFLEKLDPQMKEIYATAGKNADLLEWIPCYCGCGESVGHKSNKNCFIHEIKSNGEVVWDSHATTCMNCLEIAAESASMQQKGKSTLEIRNYIDKKYKEGYAKPTPTPMPKA
ncbi:PCYCGC motif-containing (lipo)protein [Bacillus sp. DX1.1]|uniref:PCYCGC motif-containing (lipo)protein n=1 Tax=unclassified Bacillus (in: firmicutes) TaxID=185979 RepID=UPI002570EC86|nr:MULTISPECIES: PCYCGC motif-containing (lipo)protein [unclassified Bacillus (in: firmicutes)]MDM5153538.1 PCYCGC motif-containing (lipo)protein [Bacillus sp. DX1.1]WJE82490.1 PCYCGC motif-containing (lipo)protein [Bacillus sp. DX3.1]